MSQFYKAWKAELAHLTEYPLFPECSLQKDNVSREGIMLVLYMIINCPARRLVHCVSHFMSTWLFLSLRLCISRWRLTSNLAELDIRSGWKCIQGAMLVIQVWQLNVSVSCRLRHIGHVKRPQFLAAALFVVLGSIVLSPRPVSTFSSCLSLFNFSQV